MSTFFREKKHSAILLTIPEWLGICVVAMNANAITTKDGTVFNRTPVGSFWGDPTPEQAAEIEASCSDSGYIAAVVRRNVGDLRGGVCPGFEIVYFDR